MVHFAAFLRPLRLVYVQEIRTHPPLQQQCIAWTARNFAPGTSRLVLFAPTRSHTAAAGRSSTGARAYTDGAVTLKLYRNRQNFAKLGPLDPPV